MKALMQQGMRLGQLGPCSNLGRHSTPRAQPTTLAKAAAEATSTKLKK